ncbi:hypothetical protein KIPB_002127, partial [Kipferlia bialata]
VPLTLSRGAGDGWVDVAVLGGQRASLMDRYEQDQAAAAHTGRNLFISQPVSQ